MSRSSLFARIASVAAFALAPLAAWGQSLKAEKYTLDNGLVVILHPDTSLPVASINLWYKVGAKNEPKGRSGFAHLYEHLMFMGTKRVPGNDFDVLMENGGGANNASTSLDRTNYYSNGPASLLPTLLWLDADRLEDMGPTMTQEKLDKQRDVVRNERRQTVENAPYGRAYDDSYKMMYPESHPYHFGVIGTHADLEAASVDNVKNFFATFYAPNNCSLVVAGDFDPAQIKPLVKNLFGSIPRGNVAKDRPVPDPTLGRVVRASMYDKVQLPKVAMYFHSPAQYQEGDAEMDISALVLAGGQSSRLYKRLVLADQLAVEVQSGQDSAQLGSMFRVEVLAKPGSDLSRIEAIMDEELAKFAKDGPTADELAQRVAAIETSKLSSLQDVARRADQLNEYEYFFGQPDSLKRDLDRYRTTTPAKVAQTAAKVLSMESRGIVRVLAERAPAVASARDTRPTDGTPANFNPPAPEMFTLSSGVKVQFWHKGAESGAGLPLTAATAVVNVGSSAEQPARAGLTSLTTTMLSEGTGSMDGPQFAAAMQALGAQFGAGEAREGLSVSVSSLTRNFDKAAQLWASAIKAPRFDAKDYERVKGLHLEELAQSDQEPTEVANRVAARLLMGEANPYGAPLAGLPDTVKPLTLEDIKGQHAALVRPESLTILIAGDMPIAEVKTVLEKHFGSWKPAQPNAAAALAPTSAADLAIPARSKMMVAIVDRPGAVQTVVRFAAPTIKYADEKRVPLTLANTILGGSFTSRLNQNLREKNGYTYGARASSRMERDLGWFIASSSVKADTTGAALKEFMAEFDRIKKGDISADEAGKAAKTVRTNLIQSFGTLRGTLGVAQGLLSAGAKWDSVAADYAKASTVTPEQLNALAGPSLELDKGVLVLVGDKALILEQIKGLAIEQPIEFDAQARRLAAK
ncbi:MAG: M16 family metallopeptidase [Phycisphaerales bacterium]